MSRYSSGRGRGGSDSEARGISYIYPARHDGTRVTAIHRFNKKSDLYEEVYLDKGESKWDSGDHGIPAWKNSSWERPEWLRRDWCTGALWDAHTKTAKASARQSEYDTRARPRQSSAARFATAATADHGPSSVSGKPRSRDQPVSTRDRYLCASIPGGEHDGRAGPALRSKRSGVELSQSGAGTPGRSRSPKYPGHNSEAHRDRQPPRHRPSPPVERTPKGPEWSERRSQAQSDRETKVSDTSTDGGYPIVCDDEYSKTALYGAAGVLAAALIDALLTDGDDTMSPKSSSHSSEGSEYAAGLSASQPKHQGPDKAARPDDHEGHPTRPRQLRDTLPRARSTGTQRASWFERRRKVTQNLSWKPDGGSLRHCYSCHTDTDGRMRRWFTEKDKTYLPCCDTHARELGIAK